MVEDLHWSDRITRDALLYLTTMAREGRWALVVTFRDDEVAARPVREFLEVLDHDALVYVTLDALSAQEVAAQIAGIADAAAVAGVQDGSTAAAAASRCWLRRCLPPRRPARPVSPITYATCS